MSTEGELTLIELLRHELRDELTNLETASTDREESAAREILRLQAEVERLRHRNNALKTHYEGCQRRENEYREREQHCRTKWSDAETKLAAIEALPHYTDVDVEQFLFVEKIDPLWIRLDQVDAILRGEGT